MTPCEWALPPITEDSACSALVSASPEEQALYQGYATELLWNWTGRIFGLCAVELRPCRVDCDQLPVADTFWGGAPTALPSRGWRPALIGGRWQGVGCGNCLTADNCTCGLSEPTSIILPGPVEEVTEVLIDGEALPTSSYRLAYRRFLIRTDGSPWPSCQDLSLAADEPGAFTVRYLRGVPVPPGGIMAAQTLACELAKAITRDNTCQLPRRVTSISRQGVTVAAALDTFDDLERGRTGIWLIDSWVSAMQIPRVTSSVRSVDIPTNRVGGRPWRT